MRGDHNAKQDYKKENKEQGNAQHKIIAVKQHSHTITEVIITPGPPSQSGRLNTPLRKLH